MTTSRTSATLTAVGLAAVLALTACGDFTVAVSATGCQVTYDAELILNGVLRCADFVLKPLFKRIGDRAAKGLTTALGGVVVSS